MGIRDLFRRVRDRLEEERLVLPLDDEFLAGPKPLRKPPVRIDPPRFRLIKDDLAEPRLKRTQIAQLNGVSLTTVDLVRRAKSLGHYRELRRQRSGKHE